MIKELTKCRVCKSTELKEYLDLGLMPLSNNLLNHWSDKTERYPLKVLFCESCGLSQLSTVIDPQTLFGHYVYRSSISETYKKHCWDMAIDLKNRFDFDASSFHIDIAGNDGALLSQFKNLLNHKTLNVDPAENLEQYNEAESIRYYKTFWSIQAAQHLNANFWPKADLITATNVFAHVDNVHEFLIACDMVLKAEGVLVLEFPYLVDFINKIEFDTVYFEHLSYFSVGPLRRLCEEVGMKLLRIEHFDIHGGTIRCYIGSSSTKRQQDHTVFIYETNEKTTGFTTLYKYKNWSVKVDHILKRFKDALIGFKADGQKVWAFAASAKGNVLLNAANINYYLIECIIDQTPEKIGKYSPGTGIPILSMDDLVTGQPDYLIILSWNFADEIIDKCRAVGYKGKFILPLTLQII